MNVKNNRKAQIERKTRETNIFAEINIDGSGVSEVVTEGALSGCREARFCVAQTRCLPVSLRSP